MYEIEYVMKEHNLVCTLHGDPYNVFVGVKKTFKSLTRRLFNSIKNFLISSHLISFHF